MACNDVAAAYDRRASNPFKRWTPNDFQLQDMDVEVIGLSLIYVEGNRLTAQVSEADSFNLRVRGFDNNRDVRVNVSGRAV